MAVITLLTDYGIQDSYVAEVKGVMLRINPDATIVDISHDVGNYEISSGAFHMARSAPYFPRGTTHVGVVDPTVGSKRKAIIIKTENAWFVGPDNGLLAPAAERLGVQRIYEIKGHPEFPLKLSEVFDGRDVFGPTGALLSNGVPPQEIGEEIKDYVRLKRYQAEIKGDKICTEIIHVDGFGNCITNVTYSTLKKLGVSDEAKFEVKFDDSTITLPYVSRFSLVPVGEPLLLVAGGGYLEIAINQGNAQKKFGLVKGDRINLSLL
jgi:S-adenosylmethionine hydrolase